MLCLPALFTLNHNLTLIPGKTGGYTLHIGHMPGSHTAAATTTFFQDVMPLFGFSSASQVFFMACSDGGANAFNAMVALNLVYGIPYCYCHRMHLSIKRALGQYGTPTANANVGQLFAKWRACLGHFTRSPLNLGRLLALKIQNGKNPHEALRVMMEWWCDGCLLPMPWRGQSCYKLPLYSFSTPMILTSSTR